MALTFFSRCEGTTLDGTHDYSAGDTTWTLNSAAEFSATGQHIGTNGLYTPSGDDYGILDAASIVSRLAGTVAFWLRFDTYGGGTTVFQAVGTNSGTDYIQLATNWSNGFEFRHRSSVGNNQAISTSTITLAGSTRYFVQIHWSAALDSLKLEIYNSSGTLIESVENTSAGLGAAPADIINVHLGTKDGGGRVSIDNVFFGSAYADDFLSSRDITSYTSYGGGGALPTITDAGDESYAAGETGITITGTNFGASQGSGSVKISPTDNVADANAVTQTVTSWGDLSIQFTCVRGTLPANTTLYLFVTNNNSVSNGTGYQVQIKSPLQLMGGMSSGMSGGMMDLT